MRKTLDLGTSGQLERAGDGTAREASAERLRDSSGSRRNWVWGTRAMEVQYLGAVATRDFRKDRKQWSVKCEAIWFIRKSMAFRKKNRVCS